VHRPGASPPNVDALSRLPQAFTEDCTGARLGEGPVGPPPGAPPAVAAPVALPASGCAASSGLSGLLAKRADAADPYPGMMARVAYAAQADAWSIPAHYPAADALPSRDELAAGGPFCDDEAPHARFLRQRLHAEVRACTHEALGKWATLTSAERAGHQSEPPQLRGAPGPHGWLDAYRVDGQALGSQFLSRAASHGVVVYEPFGGLCAGLEMVLRNGIAVTRYIYQDTDPAARQVAAHRVRALMGRYPGLLPWEAVRSMCTLLPHDITQVTPQQLIAAGAQSGEQWLMVAGWECQDLSPAGKCEGLAGPRSRTFFDTVRVLGWLQQLQPELPPAYILENTAMQFNFVSAAIREGDFARVCAAVGTPVVIDAAQFGSHAHRTRNYWTNLAEPWLLEAVRAEVRRPGGRSVASVLDPGRVPQAARRRESPPQHPCNTPGQPMRVLPTLVAKPASRAFRDGAPGMVVVQSTGELCEPNPEERERILGYPTGSTAAPRVTALQRHEITGRCMDAFVMERLLAMCLALASTRPVERVCVAAVDTLPEPFGASRGVEVGYRVLARLLAPGERSPLGKLPRWADHLASSRGHKRQWGLGASRTLARQLPSRSTQPATLESVFVSGGQVDMSGRGRPQASARPTTELGGETGVTAAQATAVDRPRRVTFQQEAQVFEYDPDAPVSEPPIQLSSVASEHVARRVAHALAADADDGEPPAEAEGADIWHDEGTLHYLQRGSYPEGASAADKKRISNRAQRYAWRQGKLWRRLADGVTKEVPPISERTALVTDMHIRNGHPGEKKLISLLTLAFLWKGMTYDAIRCVRACAECDRSRASNLFHGTQPELHSLPIMGPMYRWGVDMAGEFVPSKRGYKYVMVCVEHFTKFVVLIPLRSKESAETARAFQERVLAYFGAPAEVLTDQGGEFMGAFDEMLTQSLIDHRTTSAANPKADGLAERSVQTCKRALEKHVMQEEDTSCWDEVLPRVMLAHNSSTHSSTKFRPYTLVYGTDPVVPPAVREKMEGPIDWDDEAAAAASLLERAEAMRRHVVVAGGNLEAAQHRDTLQYAKVRSGGYLPRIQQFEEGDFVYLRKEEKQGLDMRARRHILRVSKVRPHGVLVLQGRCGETISVNVCSVAPCHLPFINPAIDHTLARPSYRKMCQGCQVADKAVMLLCDTCGLAWHLSCLRPPLRAVPHGAWLCEPCVEKGETEATVQARRLAAAQPGDDESRPAGWQEGGGAPRLHTDPLARRKGQILKQRAAEERQATEVATARALHHQRVERRHPTMGRFRGTLVFREHAVDLWGPAVPCFWAMYDDGDYETLSLEQATRLLLQPQDAVPQPVPMPPEMGLSLQGQVEKHPISAGGLLNAPEEVICYHTDCTGQVASGWAAQVMGKFPWADVHAVRRQGAAAAQPGTIQVSTDPSSQKTVVHLFSQIQPGSAAASGDDTEEMRRRYFAACLHKLKEWISSQRAAGRKLGVAYPYGVGLDGPVTGKWAWYKDLLESFAAVILEEHKVKARLYSRGVMRVDAAAAVSPAEGDSPLAQAAPGGKVSKGGASSALLAAAMAASVPDEAQTDPLLPDVWQPPLTDVDAVGLAANRLGVKLPRSVSERLVTELQQALPLKGLLSATRAGVAAAVLAENVHLPGVFGAVDLIPCPVLRDALKAHGLKMASPRAETLRDALQPGRLQKLYERCPPDVVIGAAPGEVADLALPLATRYVTGLVALLVPYAYFTRSPVTRIEQLQAARERGLLHLCPVPGAEAGTVQSAWIIVMASDWAMRRLLRPGVALAPELRTPVLR